LAFGDGLAFLTGELLAFLAGAFLSGEAFFAGAFFAAVFLTGEAFGELLGAVFLAGAFFAAPFLAGGAATGSSVALRLTGEGEGATGSAAAFFPLVVFFAGVLALGVTAFAGAFLPLVDFFGSSFTGLAGGAGDFGGATAFEAFFLAGVAAFFTGDEAAAFLPPRVFLTGEALTGDSTFLGSGVAAFAGEEVAFLDVLRVAFGVAFLAGVAALVEGSDLDAALDLVVLAFFGGLATASLTGDAEALRLGAGFAGEAAGAAAAFPRLEVLAVVVLVGGVATLAGDCTSGSV